MPRGRALFLCVLAAWPIGAACSTFESTPSAEDAGAEASAPDTSVADSSVPSEDAADDVVTDAGGDSGVPLVVNGDFESEAGSGCGIGWQATNASGTRVNAVFRSPSTSCKVCNAIGTSSTAVAFYVVNAPPPGLYKLEAWYRTPASDLAAGQINVQIAAFTGTDVIATSMAIRSAPDATWRAAQTSLTLDAGITKLHVDIGTFAAAANECVLFDDVTLTRE